MATIFDSLKAVSAYPIPRSVIEDIAEGRGLDSASEATAEVRKSDSYRLARADLMLWVSTAPNISQGNVSFDILYSDRERLREQANAVLSEFGEGTATKKVKYGYRGDRL